MSVGFVMLVHKGFARVIQVARHLATDGSPVVIHVDARVDARSVDKMKASLRDLPEVSFSPRRNCDWGRWSMVAATRDAVTQLLAHHERVGHVCLLSGACLPLRPLAQLRQYLAAHPDTDFIESVTTADVPWTLGGLEEERFSMVFPFSWKTQRRLFDWSVRVQRALGVRRRPPAGLVPHLGSQWWCLTRTTLQAILSDPDRGRIDRYFRKVWIPDESYFQTLTRRHARQIECQSLTLSRFDVQGRPHTFYDDHLEVLRRSDRFFARKIWRGADRLYQNFLGQGAQAQLQAVADPAKIDRLFQRAADRRRAGRPGLVMAGRFPIGGPHLTTSAPFWVFQGPGDLLVDFEGWLAALTGAEVHGRLMHPVHAQFAGRERVARGGLSADARLRDYDAAAFLRNLVWSGQGTRQAFQYAPDDSVRAWEQICSDRNARITMITGAWAVPLANSAQPFDVLRKAAAKAQKRERAQLDVLKAAPAWEAAKVMTLAAYLAESTHAAQRMLDDLVPLRGIGAESKPALRDFSVVPAFLQRLRNSGMSPYLAGEVAPIAVEAPAQDDGLPLTARVR